METQNALSQKLGANMSLSDVAAAEFKAMCATGSVDDQCFNVKVGTAKKGLSAI